MYAAMFAAINGARDHVNLESYITDGDIIGRQLADLLIEKRQHGVEVNIIYDSGVRFLRRLSFSIVSD